MITVDDHSLRDLIAKHQENMAGAAGLSLFASLAYAILKQFDFKRSCLHAGTIYLQHRSLPVKKLAVVVFLLASVPALAQQP